MSTDPRTILITGAAGRLGAAVAQLYAERGARLVLVDRNPEPLAAMVEAMPGSRSVVVDLFDAAAAQAAIDAALEEAGRVEVLCHLAGGFRMGQAVHQTSAETWDFLVDINARTLLHIARAVVPHMIAAGGGKIVTVGSVAGLSAGAHMGAYSAAKAGVLRLTEAMSAELRERGINVNCVLPTVIDTPENRAAMPAADPSRWVSPRALAEVIAFLASDAARAIHGAALPVTGLA